MEEVMQDPTALAATAVGGLVLLAGLRLALGGGKAAEEKGKAEEAEAGEEVSREIDVDAVAAEIEAMGGGGSKSKAAKSKASKKKKAKKQVSAGAAAPAKKQAPAPTPAAPEPVKKEAPASAPAKAPAKAPEAAAAPSASGGSKKKKKKSKKSGGGGGGADATQSAQQKAKEAEERAAIVAAQRAAAEAAAEEERLKKQAAEAEWETVPKRRRKKVSSSTKDATAEVDGSGMASMSLEIGEFGPTIIGSGGSRINAIQEESGAQVKIDKGSNTCEISGTLDQVNKAKDMVIDIVGSQRKDVIDVGMKRGLVFGPGGETIQKIQSESGARLEIAKGESLLTVSGKRESVLAAVAMVEEILNGTSAESVVIADSDKAAIIGKGGANIRKLQEESGASLDIDGETNVCTITGEPAQVQKARELVALYIAHRGPPPEATETLSLPLEHGRLVIGKKGATVTELQSSTKTRIDINLGALEATVQVKGDKEDVAAGVRAIRKLIADNSHQAVVALSTPNLVRAILGTKGETINNIRDTSNARVEIAQDNQSCRITGTTAQVAKAKGMVEKKIAEELGPPPVPEGQTQFTADLGGATGKIIGSQGSNISRLETEHGVDIVVKNGTMCFVTGAPDSVEKCQKEIEDVVRRHEEMLAKAKLQEEELKKVTEGSDMANGGSAEGAYTGWDAPALDGNWNTAVPAANGANSSGDAWGAAPPAANGGW